MTDTPNLTIERALVADLVPYARNSKEHPAEQVDAIAESMRRFGMCDPVGVWTNADGALEIVEGHGRVMAAQRLGVRELPIIRLDHLTDEERRAYSHVHNQTTLTSGLDMDVLRLDMEDLPEFDWGALGFEEPEREPDPEDVLDDEPPESVPTRCEPGDVWQLGRHRLMCGDASEPADVETLLAGVRPMFVFADPPYGVAVGSRNKTLNDATPGKGGRHETDIAGDTMDMSTLHGIIARAFQNLRRACDPAASYYVTGPQGGDLMGAMQALADAGLPVRHNLVWVKNHTAFSMGRLDYDYKHEPIMYTWGASHVFRGGFRQSVIDDTTPVDKMSKAQLKELVRALMEEHPESVIYCDKPNASRLHPTMKPVRLVARLMANSSAPGDACADVFAGSGTTLMAAEQLGRAAYCMEIDPHYCDVILERWEQFTGGEAERVRG